MSVATCGGRHERRRTSRWGAGISRAICSRNAATTGVGCIGIRRCDMRRHRARELVHGALRIGHRAVPRRPFERGPHPADPLFGDLNRVERPPEQRHREGADLPQDVLGAHLIGVLAREKQAPLGARGLFVGDGGEDEIAVKVRLLAREHRDDARAHRRHVLHVDRAAAP